MTQTIRDENHGTDAEQTLKNRRNAGLPIPKSTTYKPGATKREADFAVGVEVEVDHYGIRQFDVDV